ncbi:hypothetical protein CWI75_17005 [Kineobactrum sediminis]|uniref:Major facilitator superfamily (MFS) profile domain-containing protein n=1 Tax=Kineobactrum sediminis TaxID=1905677 RepID=A0A2N5XYB2_9GAMM|nr:hypothetical protein CWI75_17005 [Kineobactrum sediminis]
MPSPPTIGVTHAEVGTRTNLIAHNLRNSALLRLDAGIFILHFVLMVSFQVVPTTLEATLGVARELHWQVYLPAVLLSVAGIIPLMRLAERGDRPRLAFLASIALLFVALAVLGVAQRAWIFYAGLWLFFVGFNYMEATLPSMVSKAVVASGKGTAMGIFSTAQFLGIFAGGVMGGVVLEQFGVFGITAMCLALVGLWFLLALPQAFGSVRPADEALAP